MKSFRFFMATQIALIGVDPSAQKSAVRSQMLRKSSTYTDVRLARGLRKIVDSVLGEGSMFES